MNLISDILKSIGSIEDILSEHSFTHFKYKGQISSLNENIEPDLFPILQFVSGSLLLEIQVTVGDNTPIRFSTKNLANISVKFEQLQQEFDVEEVVHIEITSTEWSQLNIFDWEVFLRCLTNLSLKETLSAWATKFEEPKIIVNIWEEFPPIENDYILLRSAYPIMDESLTDRWDKLSASQNASFLQARIDLRDKVSHFANADGFSFAPEVFDFSNSESFKLKCHFDHLVSIFSLIFICDYSSVTNDGFSFKIKGYKTLSGKLDSPVGKHVQDELLSIYKWVYSGGPFVDKIGIARNVISIHMNDDDINTLELGTCDSAQSGYDLYLKDNVKQYIEVKNKISDMLFSQSEKASTIVKDMFAMFKTSMWTFITFFLTAFLIKAVKPNSTNGVVNTVSLDMASFVIGVCLIILSLIYLQFARQEVNDELIRLKQKYREIEVRYKDLLNEKDLTNILNQSKLDGKTPKEREVQFVRDKRKKYTKYWILINIALLIVLIILFFSNDILAYASNIIYSIYILIHNS